MASPLIESLIEAASTFFRPDMTIEELRAAVTRIVAMRPPMAGCEVSEETSQGVNAQWVRHVGVPAGAERVVCWFHGGGYCSGDPAMMHGVATFLSRETGARMFLPRYRIAPEHPHPAALEDALAAYRWLVAGRIDPGRVVLGGDSAGGGLALATLLALREAGDPLPAASVTFSPWTDLTISGESILTRRAYTFGMSEVLMRTVSSAYLAGRDPREPAVSPLFGDWSGMPPMQIQVGDHEVLLSDSTRLAERARAAGVEVELLVWPGMPHVHQAFVGAAPESDEACSRAARFVRGRLRAG